MAKSNSISKGLKSFLGPLWAPGSPSAASHSRGATPATSIRPPTPSHDLALNNLATACGITKDVAEALNQVPYIKAVTGVVAQIIKIHEEVQGNNDRCAEMISMVKDYTCTVIRGLAKLYAAKGEHGLEPLKSELESFLSQLEAILENDLEPLKNQSRWKAYSNRDKDAEDMKRIERELKGFVDRFTIEGLTESVSAAEATKSRLSEIQQQAILGERWLRSQHSQYNIAVMDASPYSIDRAHCAPGTRQPILERITIWARDRSPESPAVFWMVGEGGAGKSTIARTIAEQFDGDDALPTIVTFFCSRKFSDTNQQVYIIPTLAYQLARLCEFYSSELLKDPKIVDSLGVISQHMDSLLVQPWKAAYGRRSLDAPPFLVIIDALDEIVSRAEGDEMSGGYAFLKSLLTVVEQGNLKGIKFLVTSRPHPELSAVCGALPSEATCRLYDIPKVDVEQDIYRYLQHRLPKLKRSTDLELLERVAAKADGLFIFASTAVLVANPTTGTAPKEQRQALQGILDDLTHYDITTSPVNSLYCQVLGDAFKLRSGTALSDRLELLHTIICAEDRVSIDVLVSLVLKEGDDREDAQAMVEDLLHRLHAVLWISDGCITWYHASFLDFILSPASASIALPARTLDASCNIHSQHTMLARQCFYIMRSHLKFNICQLPSSFLFDFQVEDLDRRVEDHISLALRYACRYWAIHTSKSRGNEMQENVMRFLEENLLFWIEVMNLIGQSSLCATLFTIMQQYASQHFSNAPELCKDLSAASHFSTVFKGSHASKSTPHLYMSTLVYKAPRFPLLRRWRARFAKLPAIHTRGIDTQLLVTLQGHTKYVSSVALSPDGSRIVSGSWDLSVRVWDVQTGEQVNKLDGHIDSVYSVAFSPDGSRIVSGSDDHSVRVWDVQTGEQTNKLDGHTDSVNSVAFSSDGSLIVSGSWDFSVRVWDVQTGEEIIKLDGHLSHINPVAFSPDSSRIVSGSWDLSVRIWDVQMGAQINKLDGHTDPVYSVAFSPDGSRIVSGSEDRSIRVWDVQSGQQVKKLDGHTGAVYSVAFSSDGSRIVSGSSDCSIRVWDVQTGEQINKLDGHAYSVMSVVFFSDCSRIVSGSSDCSIRVWDIRIGDEINKLDGHTGAVYSVAFSPDGSRIVSGSDDHSLRVWDVHTGEQIDKLDGHTKPVYSVAFSSDGSRIVSASYDQSVRIWDVQTGEQINKLDSHTGSVKSVTFSSDCSRMMSGSYDSSVQVWDVQTGEQVNKLDGHTGNVNSVALSLDGSRIVSGSEDRSIRVWDVQMGQKINKLDGHTDSVTSVAFSSDGSRIVSGSWDFSVRVWGVQTGEQINKLDGHTGAVHSVAFSPDGSRIVSGSWDLSVRVWDVQAGEEINKLDGHTDLIHSVAFSSDGSHIVSGSFDRSIRVWSVTSPSELPEVTHIANSAIPAIAYPLGSELVFPAGPKNQLDWTVDDDGWIIKLPTMERIMWLPDTLTRHLYRPANTLIISQQTAKLDLEGVQFGSHWSLCYE